MIDSQTLEFGESTSKSGRKSPFFMSVDTHVTGSQLKKLREYYAKIIHGNHGADSDVLFGSARKGILSDVVITIAFSELYGKDIYYCPNRKEVKDHGDAGILLGSLTKGDDKVVIIENVTTSSKSIEETLPIIRVQDDVTILGLMVSLNRMERGKGEKSVSEEIKELYSFDVNAIVSMAEVVEHPYSRKHRGQVVTNGTIKAVAGAYYEQYGAK